MLPTWETIRWPMLGMLHLPPLPGSPRFAGDMAAVLDAVLADALVLAEAGFDGIMLENFGDAPFYPARVPPVTISWMTRLASEVRRIWSGPLGINVLRNDGLAALAIAGAVGAELIRVNVLTGARVADQGLLVAEAHELLRQRRFLGLDAVKIFADVDVKHSSPLGDRRDLADEVHDLIDRGLADSVVVSGSATGRPTDLAQIRAVKTAAGSTPVWVGSGATLETLAALCQEADGVIVGSALKAGASSAPQAPARAALSTLDRERSVHWMQAVHALRRRGS